MIANALDKEHLLKPFILRQAVALLNASPALKRVYKHHRTVLALLMCQCCSWKIKVKVSSNSAEDRPGEESANHPNTN